MKPLLNYIITTENRYNNKVDVDGKELIVNTEITERDAQFVNRIGTVEAVPLIGDNILQVGDEVVVHHNVFRRWIDGQQKEKNSGNYFSEDTYFVYHDQIFAYKRNGEWSACPGYCFVAPQDNEDTWMGGRERILRGVMKYPDETLKDQGIVDGSLVGFTPNSEYEFYIDGIKLYRIFSNQININYGLKEETREAAESF